MASFTVPAGPPLRVDLFLAQTVPGWSRRVAQRAIAEGKVTLQRRALRKGAFTREGDVFEIDDQALTAQNLLPNAELSIAVVHEDADVVVLNKPAGIPAVALRASERDTAANFLLAGWPAMSEISALEAGLVQRLDTNTSGLLLAAKSVQAHAELRRQFTAQTVTKEYLAVVHGEVRAAGSLTTPIAHDRRRRDRMRIAGDGRPAKTWYTPVSRYRSATLLRVQISSGVMHQIRVHLASIGHPVVGDALYGSASQLPGGRHLLHAYRLGFVHPQTLKPVHVECAAPADFEEYAVGC